MTSEPILDSVTIVRDMQIVAILQPIASILNAGQTAWISHCLRGEVGVRTCTI
jgi:hypothetical protein